jgi:transcriptional regulator with XRE-family HTH domain
MAFKDWLLSEIEAAGLSNSELARRAGVSHARVSQVLGGDSPGKNFLIKIADVLGKPRSEVFRAAGLVETNKKLNPIVESTAAMLNDLPEEEQEDFRAMVRVKWERRQKRQPVKKHD